YGVAASVYAHVTPDPLAFALHERDGGGLAAAEQALLDADRLRLLDVKEAAGTDVREKDTRAVEDANGQASVLGNGQIADFDLVGAVRPLADPERAHPFQAGDRHPVAELTDQPQPVLAVDDHVLPIVPCLDEDRVPRLRIVNGRLDFSVGARAVQRHDQGPADRRTVGHGCSP